jgi:hypothetical protein
MASKKRRSYRGTPEQHAADAALYTRNLRRGIKETRQFLRNGNCYAALNALSFAHRDSGLQSDAFDYAPRSAANKRTGRRSRGGSVSSLIALKRDFFEKCVKRSR